MGRQIHLLQTRLDEQAMLDALLPWDPVLIPTQRPDGDLPVSTELPHAQRLLVVPAATRSRVLAATQYVPGRHSVDFRRTEGLFLEWNRTMWETPTVARGGRCYLWTNNAPDALVKMISFVQRWIRKYPAQSIRQPTYYIGPDLWTKVQAGKVEIRNRQGMPLDVKVR